MTEDDCWRIVEAARMAAGGDIEEQGKIIAQKLAARCPADIVAFSQWTRTKMMDACRSDLLTAVEWICAANELPYASGDLWEYVRAWLVGHGRRAFYAALQDPDVLADLYTTFDDFTWGEAIEYAALEGYRLRESDAEPPDEMFEPSVIETWPGDVPRVERTHERLMAAYPKLAGKFGPPQCRLGPGGAAAG